MKNWQKVNNRQSYDIFRHNVVDVTQLDIFCIPMLFHYAYYVLCTLYKPLLSFASMALDLYLLENDLNIALEVSMVYLHSISVLVFYNLIIVNFLVMIRLFYSQHNSILFLYLFFCTEYTREYTEYTIEYTEYDRVKKYHVKYVKENFSVSFHILSHNRQAR